MTGSGREFLVYSSGALAAFCVDLAVLTLLVEFTAIHYLVAATTAFVLGTAVVYWVSVRHAFVFRRVKNSSGEFSLFVAIGIGGVVLNAAVIYIAVEVFELHYLIGKLASASVTFMSNYGLRKVLLFTSWPAKARTVSDDPQP
jgi:putative flippase GtrA